MCKLSLLVLLLLLLAGCSENRRPVDTFVSPPLESLSIDELPPAPPSPIPIPYPLSTDAPTTFIADLCGSPTVYDWFAGRITDVGSITVYNNGENLYVTVNSTVGIKTLHGWVGTDLTEIPEKPNGSRVAPGQLPWQKSFDAPVYINTWTLRLTDVPGLQNTDGTISDGKPIYVILHAALANDESAYGGNWGLNITASASWWYFIGYTYQSCPSIL